MLLADDILTTFGITWQKLSVQVVLFLVALWVLNRYAFGPMIKMFEERRRRIEEGQMNAEKIKKQLSETEIRYQEILRKANTEAQQLLDEARKSSDAITQKQLQEAISQAEGIITKAREAITIEHDKMVADVRKSMITLVVDTTAQVTGKILTPEDHERLNAEVTGKLAA